MTTSQDEQGRRSIIERHLQSVLLAVITAVLLYMGQFVITSREESVRIATQLAVLTNEVAALRGQLSAMQTSYATREEWRDHETRLRAIEQPGRPQR